jgi:hypothetical protein
MSIGDAAWQALFLVMLPIVLMISLGLADPRIRIMIRIRIRSRNEEISRLFTSRFSPYPCF